MALLSFHFSFSFESIFYYVHPFNKVKKEMEYVVTIIKKKNGK